MLPANRKPLRHRSGEQILHTISAPPPSAGRLFHAAVCSQLLANPCSSVPGSKFFTQIPRLRPGTPGFFKARFAPLPPANPCGFVPGSKFFTQIPRRRPGTAGFSKARFAPRSPLALVAPSRGANSSHNFRASAQCRPAFSRRGLLPPPREPLKFRSGEQILHTNSALPHKKHLAGLSARCFPLSNSSLAGLHSLLHPAVQYSPRGSQSRGALLIN